MTGKIKIGDWELWVASVYPPIQKYATPEYINDPSNWGPSEPSYKYFLNTLSTDELITLFLQLDSSSPSGLSWRRSLKGTTGPASKVRAGTPALATRNSTNKGYKYWGGSAFGIKLVAHRVAYFLKAGEYPEVVDHVNGDSFDNSPSNLRASTHPKNQQNRKRGQCKGFYWNEAAKRFYVRVAGARVSEVCDMLTARADYVRSYLNHYGHYPSPE